MVRGLISALAVAWLASAASAQPEALPPDLVPWAPTLSSWSIEVTGGGAVRELRVPTRMRNLGIGAFEMRSTAVFPTPTTQNIVQRVYEVGGGFADHLMGAFTYHPGHGHFHVDGWEELRLRVRPADQSFGAIVAQTQTTSVLIFDQSHDNPFLPGSPAAQVYTGGGRRRRCRGFRSDGRAF